MRQAVFLTLLFYSLISFSQNPSLGIRTGYSYVSKQYKIFNGNEILANHEYLKTNNNFRPAFGINCNVPISEYISFSMNANFLSEGLWNGFEKSIYYRHYLQIEPNIRFTYNFNKKIVNQVFAGIGPEFTIVFNDKDYIENHLAFSGSEPPETYKNYEIGLCVGAGIKFNCGPGTLEFTGQYGHGLTNVNRYENQQVTAYPDAVVRYYIFYYYIMAGYSLPFDAIKNIFQK